MSRDHHIETAVEIEEERKKTAETAMESIETADIVIDVYHDNIGDALTDEAQAQLSDDLAESCAWIRDSFDNEVEPIKDQLGVVTIDVSDERENSAASAECIGNKAGRAMEQGGMPEKQLEHTEKEMENEKEFHQELRETNDRGQADLEEVVDEVDQDLRSKGI